MHHFCQLINHNKNGILGHGAWEVCDEVHKRDDHGFLGIRKDCTWSMVHFLDSVKLSLAL